MEFNCRIQQEDFVLADEYHRLQRRDCGAVVMFSGLVRDQMTDPVTGSLVALELEHYPGMTEKAIAAIASEATKRFGVHAITVIHRVGLLKAAEQIVLVGVAAPHRAAAFAACEFLMDFLKNQVPIWKKAHFERHQEWVEAKNADQLAMQRWQDGEQ